jgi:agmatine deiminase
MPGWLRSTTDRLYHRIYPVSEDREPPASPERMARYLARFDLLGTDDAAAITVQLESNAESDYPCIETAPDPARPERTPSEVTPLEVGDGGPVRIPAQWEPMEAVLLNWPILYPPLWPLHAQMAEAIAPVADVVVTVPAPMWAHAAWLYLKHRDNLSAAELRRVRFLHLPTDDIWVRDYGPIAGYNSDGIRVAVDPKYDRNPQYPNQRDDEMMIRWAAHTRTPVLPLGLETEGGNLWSDGQGTLLMSDQIFRTNRHNTQAEIMEKLHSVFEFDKLIITPRMRIESTGHIDLLVKLVDATTVLVAAPDTRTSAGRLRETADLFRHETNANGDPYTVIELPTPGLYLNWLAYPIRRSYTNALTINGRVLVPVYGVAEDQTALDIYARTMPDYTIIPIDCRVGANGGGAVHCMTKEIPPRRR